VLVGGRFSGSRKLEKKEGGKGREDAHIKTTPAVLWDNSTGRLLPHGNTGATVTHNNRKKKEYMG